MRKKILLSFIIPAYNVEDSIRRCVESICKLASDKIEIIIINDGSSDSTGNIVKSINDSRIKYLEQKNKGVSYARNRGLKEAAGEYIAFIDSDDYIIPEKYKKIIDYIDSAIEIILFTYNIISKSTIKRMESYLEEGVYEHEGAMSLVSKMLDMDVSNKSHNNIGGKVYQYIFKKNLILNNNIYFNNRLVFGEDLDFCVRVLDSCSSIRVTDVNAYNYVMNDESVSHRYRENIWEEYLNTAISVWEFIDDDEIGFHLVFGYAKAALRHYGVHCSIKNSRKYIKSILTNEKFIESLQYIGDVDFLWYEKILNLCFKKKYVIPVIFYYRFLGYKYKIHKLIKRIKG